MKTRKRNSNEVNVRQSWTVFLCLMHFWFNFHKSLLDTNLKLVLKQCKMINDECCTKDTVYTNEDININNSIKNYNKLIIIIAIIQCKRKSSGTKKVKC